MLSGMEEVPLVNTMATGQATFMLSPDGTSMTFTLSVSGITNVTAAHIHRAAFGVAGGVVVPLFTGPPKTGEFTGVLAQGTISGANLTGALLGMPLSALVAEMNGGNAYVNVHTTANPGGEIRGQIRMMGAVPASK
ncbi:MAG: CHRD domain-containing protein [Chloroflexi bacterium]|nr:CHRD domain-containing protein [Chloroflexota bacterium]